MPALDAGTTSALRDAVMKTWGTFLALAIVASSASTGVEARADDPTVEPTTRQNTENYSAEIALADLLSVATMMVIADSDLGVLSLAPFAVFSPIVHAAHGRGDAAFASLALHTGAPVVLGGLLYTLETAAGCKDASFVGLLDWPSVSWEGW